MTPNMSHKGSLPTGPLTTPTSGNPQVTDSYSVISGSNASPYDVYLVTLFRLTKWFWSVYSSTIHRCHLYSTADINFSSRFREFPPPSGHNGVMTLIALLIDSSVLVAYEPARVVFVAYVTSAESEVVSPASLSPPSPPRP